MRSRPFRGAHAGLPAAGAPEPRGGAPRRLAQLRRAQPGGVPGTHGERVPARPGLRAHRTDDRRGNAGRLMIRGAESKVIRGWAALDLVVSALFAVPPLAALLLGFLYSINGRLGGASSAPPFESVHWLFVCLMGGLGVVWAVARLVEPVRTLGLIDAVARLWVGALIAYFVFARGAPTVLLLFVATELGGALHQSWLLRRAA